MSTFSSQQLSKPTNRTVIGPRIKKEGDQVVVEYDYEHEDGSTEWSQIIFDEVLAMQYRQVSCCRESDIVDAKEVRCLVQSGFLSETLRSGRNQLGGRNGSRSREVLTDLNTSRCFSMMLGVLI